MFNVTYEFPHYFHTELVYLRRKLHYECFQHLSQRWILMLHRKEMHIQCREVWTWKGNWNQEGYQRKHPVSTFICIEELGGNAQYLFHFGEMKGVFVVGSKLHEPHVRWLWQFCDALYAGEEPVITKTNVQLRKRELNSSHILQWYTEADHTKRVTVNCVAEAPFLAGVGHLSVHHYKR